MPFIDFRPIAKFIQADSKGGTVHNSFRTLMSAATLIALGLALTGMSSPAGAQQAAAANSAARNVQSANAEVAVPTGQLQPIIVTASRRSENAMTSSISLTSLDASQLEQNGVKSLVDLQYVAPNMSIQPTGVSQQINIRGVGQQSTDANAIAGVPLYQDGLLLPQINGGFDYFDMANVTVLRGPQGTYAGASSIAGAVFMTSADPRLGQGVTGNFTFAGGNYSDFVGRGAVNMPLSDTLAARAAFYVENRKSFFRDIALIPGPGNADFASPGAPGALDEKEMRVSLLWKPNDNLSVLWKTQVGIRDTGGYPYIPSPPVPGSPAPSFYPSTCYPTCTRVLTDVDEMDNETTWRSTLEAKYRFDNGITIRSLSGMGSYRTLEVLDDNANAVATPDFALALEHADQAEQDMQEELDVLSPTTDRFQWLLGAFFIHSKLPSRNYVTQTGLDDAYISNLAQKYSDAVFAHGAYQVTSKWKVEAGVRYTQDHAHVEGLSYGGQTPGTPTPYNSLSGRYSGSNVTGKVALNYQLDGDNLLYAFAARGANSGGVSNGVPFQPTTDMDYEAGWKSIFFSGHARLQLDGYRMNIKNQQFDAITPITGAVSPTNFPRSTSEGVEAALQMQVHGFGADLSAAYNHTTMGPFDILNMHFISSIAVPVPQCAPGEVAAPGVCQDYGPLLLHLSNKPLPYAPKVTFAALLRYTFLVGSGDTLTPLLGFTYQGSQWMSPVEEYPIDYEPAYGLVNAQLAYQHGPYGVTAYVKNLTDRTYVSGQSPPAYFIGPPRQYGVRVSVKF
ncbi:MAG: TonB-dependent receptor [Steroidobacteraceae bacterium]